MMIATNLINLRAKLDAAIVTSNSPITGHYVTMTTAGIVTGVQAIHTVTNGVTPVEIVPVAAPGYVNVLKNLQVSNADSATTNVILEQWDGTTARTMSSSPLAINQFLTLDSEGKITLSAPGGIAGTGTVTQVQGNGTVNGLSLSGNVTTSGNITLGGSLTGTAANLTAGNVTNIPALSGAITGNATGSTTLTAGGFSSTNLFNALTNKTGTGLNVFDTNATLNTPNLTTPSFVNLTNALGLPLTTGVSGILPVAKGGVPVGGTAGQVLAKIDSADNNVQWTTAAGGGGGGAIGKNYLHNSNFAINQLALTGTVTLAANSKDAHDRFKAGASGCTYTFATVAGKTTITITAGTLIQTVNGLDLPSGSNTMCLSFGGTSTGKIGAGTAGASGVTGSVTGGANLDITFSVGSLWEVKLEKGSTPTAYEQPNYAQEWANCLLYFEVYLGGATNQNMFFQGKNEGTNRCYTVFHYSPKNITPTITITNSATLYVAYSTTEASLTYTQFFSSWVSKNKARVFFDSTGFPNALFTAAIYGTVKIDARL